MAADFWPDVLESSARASLRTALATPRRDLGEEAAGSVVAGRDRVGIEDTPDVRIDASMAGQKLGVEVEAADHRGHRHLERDAGTIRVAR